MSLASTPIQSRNLSCERGVAWANAPKSELLLAALRLWELKNGYR
jgi:hypothetical protein